jgi:hypothetical protein
MPNRIIKESIKTSHEIDQLSWFEEVVFIRLMVTVDDYGCYDGRAVVLKNALFPTKETVTKKSIEDAIQKLASVGLVRCYEANGAPYLYLPTWELHQRVRNKHRKYPEPPLDSELLSNDSQTTASCQSESNPIQSESESESLSECMHGAVPAAVPEDAFIELPLNDKTLYPVYAAQIDAWRELYPNVNIEQELRKMKGWLDANPKRRKTLQGIKRFINNWLSKEQDRGALVMNENPFKVALRKELESDQSRSNGHNDGYQGGLSKLLQE